MHSTTLRLLEQAFRIADGVYGGRMTILKDPDGVRVLFGIPQLDGVDDEIEQEDVNGLEDFRTLEEALTDLVAGEDNQGEAYAA